MIGAACAGFVQGLSGFVLGLVGPYIVGGLAGLPLGLLLLPHLDVAQFRAGGRWADAVAGACGGFMGPLGGFTGAIPTLWCTLRGLERDAQRSVVQNFNLALLTTTLAAYLATGRVTRPMLPLMALMALVASALRDMT